MGRPRFFFPGGRLGSPYLNIHTSCVGHLNEATLHQRWTCQLPVSASAWTPIREFFEVSPFDPSKWNGHRKRAHHLTSEQHPDATLGHPIGSKALHRPLYACQLQKEQGSYIEFVWASAEEVTPASQIQGSTKPQGADLQQVVYDKQKLVCWANDECS